MSIADDYSAKVLEMIAMRDQLDEAESTLYRNYDLALSLGEEALWQEKFSEVNASKSLLDATITAVDEAGFLLGHVADLFSWMPGLQGRRQSTGLGLLPTIIAEAIPPVTIGGIVALIAACGVVYAGVKSVIEYWKGKELERRIAAGESPQAAAQATYGEAGIPVTNAISNVFLFGALGLGALLLLRR